MDLSCAALRSPASHNKWRRMRMRDTKVLKKFKCGIFIWKLLIDIFWRKKLNTYPTIKHRKYTIKKEQVLTNLPWCIALGYRRWSLLGTLLVNALWPFWFNGAHTRLVFTAIWNILICYFDHRDGVLLWFVIVMFEQEGHIIGLFCL